MLIQYGKYEITPGASGLPSVVVPKKVLKQYMSKEMYEMCFAPESLRIAEVMNTNRNDRQSLPFPKMMQ